MALFERYGLGCDSFLEYPDRIEEVTARQVRKAARKYLAEDRLVEVIVVPGAGEEPGASPGADAVEDTGKPAGGSP